MKEDSLNTDKNINQSPVRNFLWNCCLMVMLIFAVPISGAGALKNKFCRKGK